MLGGRCPSTACAIAQFRPSITDLDIQPDGMMRGAINSSNNRDHRGSFLYDEFVKAVRVKSLGLCDLVVSDKDLDITSNALAPGPGEVFSISKMKTRSISGKIRQR